MKTLAALLLMTTAALAGREDAQWNPPPQYDKPFPGPTVVVTVPPAEVKRACRPLNAKWETDRARGCARVIDGTCHIVTIKFPFYGTTPEYVLRHERGHCNGWVHD